MSLTNKQFKIMKLDAVHQEINIPPHPPEFYLFIIKIYIKTCRVWPKKIPPQKKATYLFTFISVGKYIHFYKRW
jgi:hypothetical protein